MAFTTDQTKELDIASQRKIKGTANDTDIKNLDYAQSKGYEYKAPTTGTLEAGISGDITSMLPDGSASNKALEIMGKQAQEASTDAGKRLAELQKTQFEQNKVDQQKQQNIIDTEQANQDQVMKDYDTLSTPFYQDTFDKYNDQFDTEQMINDYKTLAYDLANYGKEMTNALEVESERPSLLSVSQGRQANITSTYTSKIATAQAAMDALSGSINLVYTHINNATSAIQADREQRISYLDTVMSLSQTREGKAETALLTLTTEEKSQIENLKTQLQSEVDTIEETKEYVVELMTDPATASIVHNAGVELTDTKEEIARKINDYLVKNPQTATNTDFGIVGYDDNGKGIYGFIDSANQTVTPVGNTDLSQGIVGGYDIGVYATDPNHEAAVASILQKIGKFNTIGEMDNYIQSVAPGSPITGQMIANASTKYGVSWEMMTAMMQQDSALGTKGLGATNHNPGNIAQYDSLGTTPTAGYNNWQEGVDAVAQWLSNHKVEETKENETATNYATMINDGKVKLENVPSELRDDVVNELATMPSPQDTKQDEIAKEKAQQAKDLMSNPGLNSAVGPTALTRGNKLNWWDNFTGNTQNFISGVEQLVSGLSLDALIKAKEQGATFGALSEGEMRILSSSATKIGTWKIEKDGKVVGYDIDEESMKEELKKISELFNKAIKENTEEQLKPATTSSGTEYYVETQTGTTSSGIGYEIIN